MSRSRNANPDMLQEHRNDRRERRIDRFWRLLPQGGSASADIWQDIEIGATMADTAEGHFLARDVVGLRYTLDVSIARLTAARDKLSYAADIVRREDAEAGGELA